MKPSSWKTVRGAQESRPCGCGSWPGSSSASCLPSRRYRLPWGRGWQALLSCCGRGGGEWSPALGPWRPRRAQWAAVGSLVAQEDWCQHQFGLQELTVGVGGLLSVDILRSDIPWAGFSLCLITVQNVLLASEVALLCHSHSLFRGLPGDTPSSRRPISCTPGRPCLRQQTGSQGVRV